MLLLTPPLLLLYARACPQPSSFPLLVLPSTVRVAITTSPCTVLKAFFQIDESRAILPCASSPFSTIFHRTYIPSAVPLPFLNPCYSSPKSHSTVLLILVSKSLSNSFSRPTCQSCVMPPVVSWVMYTPFTLPCVHYQAHPLLHVLFPPRPPLAALFPFSSSLLVFRPYPQYFLTFRDEPPVVVIDHSISLHLHFSSILSSIIFLPPSSSSIQYNSSSILLHALSTALLTAFFLWPYRCITPRVGGCSPRSLMPSIILHVSRFSTPPPPPLPSPPLPSTILGFCFSV